MEFLPGEGLTNRPELSFAPKVAMLRWSVNKANIGRNESELQESFENFVDPPEADTVYDVESNRMLSYVVSIVSSGGVVGIY